MNKNIEVEGGEIAIRNSHGDLAIIPKDKRDWVKQKLSENCHSCIDSLVETLPVMEDYAQDGSLLPDWDKKNNFKYKRPTTVQDNAYIAHRRFIPVNLEQMKREQLEQMKREQPVFKADTRTDQERKRAQEYTESVLNPYNDAAVVAARKNEEKIKSYLNPYNWGVKDYTDKGDFNAAYSSARQDGEKEFMWNNKRFNTKSDMTSEQQMKVYGIPDEQRLKSNIVRDRISKNISNEYITGDGGIAEPIKRVFNAVVLNKSEKETIKEGMFKGNEYHDPAGDDALNLYLGKPQKNNTFGISNYKPTITKNNNNPIYYSLQNNEFFINNLLREASKHEGNFQMTDISGVLGQFTVNRGEDERGKYFSYYDSYDINPYKGQYSKFNSKKEDISMGIGKPFEVYDRIYYTDNIERKNQIENYKTEIDKLNKIQKEYDKHSENFTIPDGMVWEDFEDLSYKNYLNIMELEEKRANLERSPAYNKVYYTDKELSELDIDKKNFDTLALQRELSNRGYKLPKSTKKDGTFDGVWGDETKNALIDWQKSQIKNKYYGLRNKI